MRRASQTTEAYPVRAGHSAMASARHRRGGRGWCIRAGVAVFAIVLVGIVGVLALHLDRHSSSPSSPSSPAAEPDTNPAVLAAQAGLTGPAVDEIPSSATEQVLFHLHSHLQIYVNGAPKLIPYGIGIVAPYQLTRSQHGPWVTGAKAFYWLHTHDETGLIHIESPKRRGFTLGNFFDLWGQPLTPDQVGPAHGTVTAFLNGQRFTGYPRSIPLYPHAVIQLNVGTPTVPPQPYTFAPNLS